MLHLVGNRLTELRAADRLWRGFILPLAFAAPLTGFGRRFFRSLAADIPLVQRMERASPVPPPLDDDPALGVFSSAMRGLVDLAMEFPGFSGQALAVNVKEVVH